MSKDGCGCADKEPRDDCGCAGLRGDLGGMLKDQLKLARRVVDLVARGSGDLLRETVGELKAPRMAGCCDIPEPCWMPADLGEIDCDLCPGAAGRLRLRVANDGFRPQAFTVVAAGVDAGRVGIDAGDFTLGPKERRWVELRFDATLDKGVDKAELEALVWVLGCRNHYLRWTVTVGERGGRCDETVEVRDAPDYVHHWYDHFYCARSCFGAVGRPQAGVRG